MLRCRSIQLCVHDRLIQAHVWPTWERWGATGIACEACVDMSRVGVAQVRSGKARRNRTQVRSVEVTHPPCLLLQTSADAGQRSDGRFWHPDEMSVVE